MAKRVDPRKWYLVVQYSYGSHDSGDILGRGHSSYASAQKACRAKGEAVCSHLSIRAGTDLMRNPARKRNIAGYKDENGVFHPIRSGRGYDPGAVGETPRRRSTKKRGSVITRAKAAQKAARIKKQRASARKAAAMRSGMKKARIKSARLNPPIKKTGRTAKLRNFSGTVTLRTDGRVAITPSRN